jgi:hypothetical protein
LTVYPSPLGISLVKSSKDLWESAFDDLEKLNAFRKFYQKRHHAKLAMLDLAVKLREVDRECEQLCINRKVQKGIIADPLKSAPRKSIEDLEKQLIELRDNAEQEERYYASNILKAKLNTVERLDFEYLIYLAHEFLEIAGQLETEQEISEFKMTIPFINKGNPIDVLFIFDAIKYCEEAIQRAEDFDSNFSEHDIKARI